MPAAYSVTEVAAWAARRLGAGVAAAMIPEPAARASESPGPHWQPDTAWQCPGRGPAHFKLQAEDLSRVQVQAVTVT